MTYEEKTIIRKERFSAVFNDLLSHIKIVDTKLFQNKETQDKNDLFVKSAIIFKENRFIIKLNAYLADNTIYIVCEDDTHLELSIWSSTFASDNLEFIRAVIKQAFIDQAERTDMVTYEAVDQALLMTTGIMQDKAQGIYASMLAPKAKATA